MQLLSYHIAAHRGSMWINPATPERHGGVILSWLNDEITTAQVAAAIAVLEAHDVVFTEILACTSISSTGIRPDRRCLQPIGM